MLEPMRCQSLTLRLREWPTSFCLCMTLRFDCKQIQGCLCPHISKDSLVNTAPLVFTYRLLFLYRAQTLANLEPIWETNLTLWSPLPILSSQKPWNISITGPLSPAGASCRLCLWKAPHSSDKSGEIGIPGRLGSDFSHASFQFLPPPQCSEVLWAMRNQSISQKRCHLNFQNVRKYSDKSWSKQ